MRLYVSKIGPQERFDFFQKDINFAPPKIQLSRAVLYLSAALLKNDFLLSFQHEIPKCTLVIIPRIFPFENV